MAQHSRGDSRSIYHRWRSQSFSEVVAQEHVTRTLKNAVATGRVVHAYLFCGPRGTGKTSTARILAKAVNCLNPQQGEPCNDCASCVAMSEGRAIDLIEIDAASNRGIDDARELREKIKFAPGESRYKVYIIDEAHMLTSEASNALLKTLEEPPEHAIIVLATTEAHKILPTISSRCQRFDFRRIPLQSIVQQLEMICRSEGLKVEAGVLEMVGRMARGSLRDAESLLDQLVAYCGSRIELPAAREVLGLAGEEAVPELAEALRCCDLARGFRLIDAAASAGTDLRHLSRELVDYLRALMVAKSGADTSLVQEFRGEELAALKASAESWGYQQLLAALRSFTDLEGRMRLEPFNQLHLEIAFMEAALPRAGLDAPRVEDAGASAGVGPEAPLVDAVPAGGSRFAEGAPATQRPVTGEDAPVVAEEKEDARCPGEAPSLDMAGIRREWPRILQEFRKAGLGIVMARCKPLEVVDNTISLGFEGTGCRHALERPGVRGKVEESLGKVFGTRVSVQFRYGVKGTGEVAPERDPVVETAVRDFGFKISRVEPVSD